MQITSDSKASSTNPLSTARLRLPRRLSILCSDGLLPIALPNSAADRCIAKRQFGQRALKLYATEHPGCHATSSLRLRSRAQHFFCQCRAAKGMAQSHQRKCASTVTAANRIARCLHENPYQPWSHCLPCLRFRGLRMIMRGCDLMAGWRPALNARADFSGWTSCPDSLKQGIANVVQLLSTVELFQHCHQQSKACGGREECCFGQG